MKLEIDNEFVLLSTCEIVKWSHLSAELFDFQFVENSIEKLLIFC